MFRCKYALLITEKYITHYWISGRQKQELVIIVSFGLSAPEKLAIYSFIYQTGQSINVEQFIPNGRNVKVYFFQVVHSMKFD